MSGSHLLIEYLLSVWSLAWVGPRGLIRVKRQRSEYTANVPPAVDGQRPVSNGKLEVASTVVSGNLLSQETGG